jgi:hypothetical protein
MVLELVWSPILNWKMGTDFQNIGLKAIDAAATGSISVDVRDCFLGIVLARLF